MAEDKEPVAEEPTGDVQPATFSLEPGLLKYYSSQAELMLAQYENINRLLGPTTDWTHPGTYCEILLRDFLRRFLPPGLSIDKGYFYGRATIGGEDTHCPEIDLLIHDSEQYRPLFRMEDFVIVLPEAVRGFIQVKRTLRDDKIKKALKNVVNARQHLYNVLWNENPAGWNWGRRRGWGNPPAIFNAIVGFDDEVGDNPGFYQNCLLEESRRCLEYNREHVSSTNMYVLPSFIGSLKSHFLLLDRSGNSRNQRYLLYKSIHESGGSHDNVCVQAFLYKFYQVMLATEMPPFAFPKDMSPPATFSVLEFQPPQFNNDGTVTLTRNDGWTATYRKADELKNSQVIHLVYDSSGTPQPTSALHTDTQPGKLFFQRGATVEQYDRAKVNRLTGEEE